MVRIVYASAETRTTKNLDKLSLGFFLSKAIQNPKNLAATKYNNNKKNLATADPNMILFVISYHYN